MEQNVAGSGVGCILHHRSRGAVSAGASGEPLPRAGRLKLHRPAIPASILFPALMSRRPVWLCLLLLPSAFAQRGTGEFRLSVVDAAGAPMAARADLVGQATHTEQSVDLGPDGRYVFKNLPFGIYRLVVSRIGFVSSAELIEVRSELPQARQVTLGIQPIAT